MSIANHNWSDAVWTTQTRGSRAADAKCYWIFAIVVPGGGTYVGEREGAVARAMLDESRGVDAQFNPYERRLDEIVPIERDPLTRLRLLTTQFQDWMTLGGDLRILEPFEPTGEWSG
jgi:hypothetical protein